MTEVRVGDVRREYENYNFVVTNIDFYEFNEECSVMFSDGRVTKCDINLVSLNELIKHYDTFVEAICSKEFKGDR